MRLSNRDADILHSLDRFGQLSAGHIWQLHFSVLKSKTSWDNVAKRLVRDKFIVRMGRRQVQGDGKGSGPAVYQLGAVGWQYLGKRGKFRPRFTAISEHRLRVADVFAQLCEREDRGEIKIRGYYCEPDTHMRLAGVTVRPDFFVELELTDKSELVSLWIEVDRDNESRIEIEKKIREYIAVFDGVRPGEIETVPSVLFLAETDIGLRNLQGYMHGKLGAYEHMFELMHIEGFANKVK
ncbi:replication-relaxation family protein [Pseudarthrobacter sp. ATCC 49987]|uniref:replication-relaxation family protein n=1 Tax=Pseudarthrobacter sp. ATCC 49987 TaxID=2698204 RepID=UPI0013692CA3|nr:replication-relaxation family protein [Pseudarthrobacter sp. ATCC 49987]